MVTQNTSNGDRPTSVDGNDLGLRLEFDERSLLVAETEAHVPGVLWEGQGQAAVAVKGTGAGERCG
jgi:hypothetical protein